MIGGCFPSPGVSGYLIGGCLPNPGLTGDFEKDGFWVDFFQDSAVLAFLAFLAFFVDDLLVLVDGVN